MAIHCWKTINKNKQEQEIAWTIKSFKNKKIPSLYIHTNYHNGDPTLPQRRIEKPSVCSRNFRPRNCLGVWRKTEELKRIELIKSVKIDLWSRRLENPGESPEKCEIKSLSRTKKNMKTLLSTVELYLLQMTYYLGKRWDRKEEKRSDFMKIK